MAATDKKLGDLHDQLADVLIKALRGSEEVTETTDAETGEVTTKKKTIRASAAEMAVAAKFLKDNAITADIEQSDKLKEMREALASKGNVSQRDMSEALKSLGGGLLN